MTTTITNVLGTMKKDPDAVLDYEIRWGDWLEEVEDTIQSVAWQVPAPLVKSRETKTETTCKLYISGGVAGESYTVTCHVTTVDGRQDDRSFNIDCVER